MVKSLGKFLLTGKLRNEEWLLEKDLFNLRMKQKNPPCDTGREQVGPFQYVNRRVTKGHLHGV